MLKWAWLGVALVASCAADVGETSREQPEGACESRGASIDVTAEVEKLIHDECHWRLPNSHASLLSSEARDLQSKLRRGRILDGTLALARQADPARVETFKRMLAQAGEAEDAEFRTIVLCRLLAACAVPRPQILKHAPGSLKYNELTTTAIKEGQALHELKCLAATRDTGEGAYAARLLCGFGDPHVQGSPPIQLLRPVSVRFIRRNNLDKQKQIIAILSLAKQSRQVEPSHGLDHRLQPDVILREPLVLWVVWSDDSAFKLLTDSSKVVLAKCIVRRINAGPFYQIPGSSGSQDFAR